jgi:hypothetical protein
LELESLSDKSARREEASGGDLALPAILPRSHDPVDDSDRRDRLPRFGVYFGLLALGIGLGSRDALLVLVGDSDIVYKEMGKKLYEDATL